MAKFLKFNILGLKFNNPVMICSWSQGLRMEIFVLKAVIKAGAGGIVTKDNIFKSSRCIPRPCMG